MAFWDDIKDDVIAHGYPDKELLTILRAWFFHPSVRMLFTYRLMRAANVKFVKRWLWSMNCRKSGCHISPSATIEPGVKFPHATGIVIGENAIIKKNAVIYQNVTLAVENESSTESPAIEENAVIYTGAVLIGSIMIGENAVVAANAVVKTDLPKDKIAAGIPAKIK